MTFDPDLAAEAKALVVLAFRNGPSKPCTPGNPARCVVGRTTCPMFPMMR